MKRPLSKVNVVEDFKNACFEDNNKILRFETSSYPVIGMGYIFPNQLINGRNTFIPKLYVRKCYKEVYDLILYNLRYIW